MSATKKTPADYPKAIMPRAAYVGSKTRGIPFVSTIAAIKKEMSEGVHKVVDGEPIYQLSGAVTDGPRAILHMTGNKEKVILLTARAWELFSLFEEDGGMKKISAYRKIDRLAIKIIGKPDEDERREVADALWESIAVAYNRVQAIAERDSLPEAEEAKLYRTLFAHIDTALGLRGGRLGGPKCSPAKIHKQISGAADTLCEQHNYHNTALIVPRAVTLAGRQLLEKYIDPVFENGLSEALAKQEAAALFENLSMRQQIVYFALTKIVGEIHDNKHQRIGTDGGYHYVRKGEGKSAPTDFTYTHKYESASGGMLLVSRRYLMELIGVTAKDSKTRTEKGKEIDADILELSKTKRSGLVHGTEAGTLQATGGASLFSFMAIDQSNDGKNEFPCEVGKVKFGKPDEETKTRKEREGIIRGGRWLTPFYKFTQLHPSLLPVDRPEQWDDISFAALRKISAAANVHEAKKEIRFNIARELMFAACNDRQKALDRPVSAFIEKGATDADFLAVADALQDRWGSVVFDLEKGTITGKKYLRIDPNAQTAKVISAAAFDEHTAQITAQKKIGKEITAKQVSKRKPRSK